jgi:hypothetical protein
MTPTLDPELRDKLLRLHRLVIAATANAMPDLVADFFEPAGDLDAPVR